MDLFDRTTYQKGFMVLDILRHLLGDEAFFGAISHYAQKYRGQTVVTDDVITSYSIHYTKLYERFRGR